MEHVRSKNEYKKLEPFGEGYTRGVVQSVSKEVHTDRTETRRLQARHDQFSLAENPSSTTISMENKSTMQDVSIQNQLLDLAVSQNTPQKDLDRVGVYRESTLAATSHAHYMDRLQLAQAEELKGITGVASRDCMEVNSADGIARDTILDLHTSILKTVHDVPLANFQNPGFIEEVYKALTYVRNAKVLRESVSACYPPDARIKVYIDLSAHQVNYCLENLLKTLEAVNVDIKILHRYNPLLEPGMVCFTEASLYASPCPSSELLKERGYLDFLCSKLRTREGDLGKVEILSKREDLIKKIEAPHENINMYPVSGQQSSFISLEDSAISQEKPKAVGELFTNHSPPLSITQKEETTSPLGEEQYLLAGRDNLGITQEESSNINVSKEESTSSTSRSTSPTSRGKGHLQSSSNPSQKSNTKVSRLKKMSPLDKNSKALTIRPNPNNNE